MKYDHKQHAEGTQPGGVLHEEVQRFFENSSMIFERMARCTSADLWLVLIERIGNRYKKMINRLYVLS